MTNSKAIFAIALMAVVTALLRFTPFIAFGRGDQTPKVITYLGKVLPYSIMGMLVIYCLKDVSLIDWKSFLPQGIAIAGIICLHVLKRNALLSIAAGTGMYMVLVQFVF